MINTYLWLRQIEMSTTSFSATFVCLNDRFLISSWQLIAAQCLETSMQPLCGTSAPHDLGFTHFPGCWFMTGDTPIQQPYWWWWLSHAHNHLSRDHHSHKCSFLQVMYMYYLLTFKLSRAAEKLRETIRMYANIDDEEMQQKVAENTYLLALDGDVDFEPQSVLTLVHKMRDWPGHWLQCVVESIPRDLVRPAHLCLFCVKNLFCGRSATSFFKIFWRPVLDF